MSISTNDIGGPGLQSSYVYASYSEYAPIDLNLDLMGNMFDNYTSGYPSGDFTTYSNDTGYQPWHPNDGVTPAWSWNDSSLHNYLPTEWPANASFYISAGFDSE